MGLSLMVIGCLMLFNVTIQSITDNLENRVDISVYFNGDVEEAKILAIRQELIELEQVKNVDYISQEQALADFQAKHKGNEVLLQSLQEFDQNPLEASLNIKANQASQYESIAEYLSQDRFGSVIDKINYKQNEEIINRLMRLTTNIQRAGWIISLALALLAVLVTFNTVRLTMFNWREEISVMRLVGAANWFIRGPFVVEGVIYGIVSSLGTLLLLFPILFLISPKITNFLPDIDLLYFYQVNFWEFLFLLLGVGILLGSLSSIIAVRRYLKS
ncbi:MAG: Efflux ABC transporter, permease protein [Parcubacteria group bacterium GW2011_GWA2_42_11]|nr:MAG: Efflux ABC transporter, permease protein [Parcubacteria group bacterium GW2011_GWA2_42_11]KKT76590.1 MAG: Efflux ABC transporter, permease protein [Parcubacteria group bacterium GW2011_GWF2_44_7]